MELRNSGRLAFSTLSIVAVKILLAPYICFVVANNTVDKIRYTGEGEFCYACSVPDKKINARMNELTFRHDGDAVALFPCFKRDFRLALQMQTLKGKLIMFQQLGSAYSPATIRFIRRVYIA